jgi:hypothetical protein
MKSLCALSARTRLTTNQSEELTDISTQTSLKGIHNSVPLTNSWAGLKEKFLQIQHSILMHPVVLVKLSRAKVPSTQLGIGFVTKCT